MKYIILFLLFFSPLIHALSLSEEQDQYIDECEVLLEQIKQSECGKTTLAFLEGAYLKIGLMASQRSMTFEKTGSQENVFEMRGEVSLMPLLTASLGDTYFENSNFGYQLGFSYFSDTAFEQFIERNGEFKTIDLGTYSKMTVLGFTPTLFYTFGQLTNKHNKRLTAGIGLTAGYSKVKGNAYLTNDTNNTACYDAGTEYVLNDANPASISSNCEFKTYKQDGLSYGARIYLAYEINSWITELSGNNFNQDLNDGYTFSTVDFSLSLSRKFGF